MGYRAGKTLIGASPILLGGRQPIVAPPHADIPPTADAGSLPCIRQKGDVAGSDGLASWRAPASIGLTTSAITTVLRPLKP